MPELLPVPLSMPRPQNVVPQRRHLDDFDTYGSLTDFRKMMSDFNVWLTCLIQLDEPNQSTQLSSTAEFPLQSIESDASQPSESAGTYSNPQVATTSGWL